MDGYVNLEPGGSWPCQQNTFSITVHVLCTGKGLAGLGNTTLCVPFRGSPPVYLEGIARLVFVGLLVGLRNLDCMHFSDKVLQAY